MAHSCFQHRSRRRASAEIAGAHAVQAVPRCACTACVRGLALCGALGHLNVHVPHRTADLQPTSLSPCCSEVVCHRFGFWLQHRTLIMGAMQRTELPAATHSQMSTETQLDKKIPNPEMAITGALEMKGLAQIAQHRQVCNPSLARSTVEAKNEAG
jgi:hypothetical protein